GVQPRGPRITNPIPSYFLSIRVQATSYGGRWSMQKRIPPRYQNCISTTPCKPLRQTFPLTAWNGSSRTTSGKQHPIFLKCLRMVRLKQRPCEHPSHTCDSSPSTLGKPFFTEQKAQSRSSSILMKKETYLPPRSNVGRALASTNPLPIPFGK